MTLRAAGAQVDIPTWQTELAQFNDAINGDPVFLTPQQQLLRELGVA